MISEINKDIFLLAMDTSSKDCSICITRNGLILVEYNFRTNKDLSSNIIKIIEFLLKQVNLNISDIDVFGIGTGPGIFTGIRVGMSTVKGLVFDSGKTVIPVNILEAIVNQYRNHNGKVVAIIDAKREQVYIAGYTIDGDSLKEYCKPQLVEVSKLDSVLKEGEKYVFVGSGAVINKDVLENTFPDSINMGEVKFFASTIAKISYLEFNSGRGKTDIEKINPLYIRKTDAEENYERDNKKGKAN